VGFFARDWFDRLLGRRGGKPRGAGERTAAFEEREAARRATAPSDIEEGATAARDETAGKRTPMPPPGTG
jgi:hypothetical protein